MISNSDPIDSLFSELIDKNPSVFQRAFEHSSIGRTLTHVDGRLLRVNAAMARLLGYTQDDLMQFSLDKVTHPEDLAASYEAMRCLKAGEQQDYRLEKRYLHRSGSVIWALVNTTLMRDSDGQPLCFITDIFNMTEQKQVERALLRSNRTYRALNRCNKALLRADQEEALFQQICDIMVKEAGYKVCWVGEATQNETLSVRVVSQCGFAQDNLNAMDTTWANTERGQDPTATCIRTQQPVLAQDIALDSDMAIWRETALKAPLVSCLSVPLITNGSVFGALTLYANESEAFNDEEVELLTQLAQDLSFGMLTLRARREHKKAKNTLQKTQKLLNESQRIAKVGGWEFDVSAGKVLWTEEVYRMHGLPLDYNPSHLEEAIQFYAPEDQERINTAFKRAVEQGKTYDLELQLNTAQGQTIWVRTDGHAEIRDGKVSRVFGNIMDITERKQAEEKLEASVKLLQSVLENIPVRVFWKDRAFKYLGCNTAFAQDAGMESPKDLLGKDDFQMAWRTQAEMYRANDKAVIDTQISIIGVEEPQTTPEGKTIWLRTSKVPLYKSSNEVIGILGVYEDITEYKQAKIERQRLREELNHSQKMEAIGRLAGGVAHDFNNMLSVIQGYTELALMQIKSEERLFRPLNEIHDAAVRSAALTRQLLAFAHKQPSTPQVIDLNKTVTGMLKMLGRLIGENIQLVWVPGAELWQVLIDPSQVDQILVNLIVNARDAIESGGKVTIETSNVTLDESYCRLHGTGSSGNYVRLAVSDNGCGMSKALLARIFEPFFTTKEKGAGTGLGLSTVYGIVKQNKGQIYIYSEPGLGSTFKIYLPVTLMSTEQDPSAKAMPTPGGGETILLVDDEPGILSMAREILVEYGYQVITAASPREALAAASEYTSPIHLLLTDVIMPEMSGKDLSLQLTHQRPELRTLYMSGYTDNVITANNALPDSVAFLQKPFSVQSLAVNVRQALDTQ